MEERLSEILDNVLGLLLLEGTYEVEETEEGFSVAIETKDAGRLIGARGESLDGLQQLVNQMLYRRDNGESGEKKEEPARNASHSDAGGFKRVILDVGSWRKQKSDELARNAEEWGKKVLETGEPIELEPQSPWQRRVVHMVLSEMDGVMTESVGEGRDRHIVIKVGPSEKT